MIKKFLQFQLSITEKGKRFERLRPVINAFDTFFYEPPLRTTQSPHIRDAIDLKRWMVLVLFALFPCILMAIWNSGVHQLIYSSKNLALIQEYFVSSHSFSSYFSFFFEQNRYLLVLKMGLIDFLPIMILSYAVGLFWEMFFACVRGHEVSEGFLVSGMLYALILPSTIPYWIVIVGVSMGVVLGKELFGGTGMNILNPALISRAFIFFAYPTKMSGNVWIGNNPNAIQTNLNHLNKEAGLSSYDGITQESALNQFNISTDIKRIHVDAIGHTFDSSLETSSALERQFHLWNQNPSVHLHQLSPLELKTFMTAPVQAGGLGLSPENFDSTFQFAKLKFSQGILTDGNFFFGNMIGSLGETSTFACLLGALILIFTGIGAWRTMLAMGIGAYLSALLFQFGSHLGFDGGAWNPAKFDLPAYKHLILGGFAFGLVFMATDPVSSPSMKLGRWIYGFVIGVFVIVIRLINPAFPEGVMLAILFGNVFAPLFDHFALKQVSRRRRARAKAVSQ